MSRPPTPGKDKRERKYGWTTLPREGREGPPPPLDIEYSERAVRLWETWWATPMALMWADHDRFPLERLLMLYQRAWDGEITSSILSEVRQLEDKFGMTPASRRRLFWQIEGLETDSKEVEVPSRGVPVSGGDVDPRKLRSVG